MNCIQIFSSPFHRIEYAIELRKIKVVRMADVEKIEPDACSGPQAFFNYIIKDFFKNLNYFEQGRQRKFHVSQFTIPLGYFQQEMHSRHGALHHSRLRGSVPEQ